jgi:hypothetical protein
MSARAEKIVVFSHLYLPLYDLYLLVSFEKLPETDFEIKLIINRVEYLNFGYRECSSINLSIHFKTRVAGERLLLLMLSTLGYEALAASLVDIFFSLL